MKGKWNQKICAIATASLLLTSLPIDVLAQENTRISQSHPEDVLGYSQFTT